MKDLKKYQKMLIVVDMINGFVREGVLHDNDIDKIIPNIKDIIEEYIGDDELIVFVKDSHDGNATEFKRFGNTNHALKGTIESELVEELIEYENISNSVSVEKNSTSYMEAPVFRKIISAAENIKQVDVVGCCTDICDFNGTMALANYLDQYNRSCDIYLHMDKVATYNEGARQKYVDAACLLLKQQGIKLVKNKGGK